MVTRINLALQGGGAHGAFTWGVLDRLLDEEDIEVAGISGTSAGALNGAAFKAGYARGGRDGARATLDALWARMGAVQDMRLPGWMGGPISWMEKFFTPPTAEIAQIMEYAPPFVAANMLDQVTSPYFYGPFYRNPLQSVVEAFDFEDVCAGEGPRLFVCATNVRTGKPRIFTRDQVTTDAILASACLPTLFQSIEPDPVGAASIAQVHRGVTTDGRTVAIKVLRPGIRERFARDIQTYEWAAAHLEAMGTGEVRRLRPALTIANFKRWTLRELDLRREAASASELSEAMRGTPRYMIPQVDWDRTNGRVMTIEWIDGTKISRTEELIAQGHDLPDLAERLVLAFLKQAISYGYFHADMHQGNLFVKADGTIAAIDFGIMGRIDRQARQWLAEILYGLTTGDYRRVAEIHFEAQYVPSHHSVDEFATALRAVGEPMRGKPVSELSVGQMLDGLFAITRDFDMQTQPHLLLLQKTMVMVEGIATQLNPKINMWDVSAPFVREWIRDELGPEAALADRIREDTETLLRVPALIRRLEEMYPPRGGAPEPPPLPEIELIGERRKRERGWLGYLVAALGGGGLAWLAAAQGWIG